MYKYYTWRIVQYFFQFLTLIPHPLVVYAQRRPVLRVVCQLHPVQSDDADGGAGPALLVSEEAAVHRRLRKTNTYDVYAGRKRL